VSSPEDHKMNRMRMFENRVFRRKFRPRKEEVIEE
jgi:hypothetical protein